MQSVNIDTYIMIIPTIKLMDNDETILGAVKFMSKLLGTGYTLLSATGDGIGNIQYFFGKEITIKENVN